MQARIGPCDQQRCHVTTVEPGDLRGRLRIGGRPRQTPASPVLGDRRHVRHDVTDGPAGAGHDCGIAGRLVGFRDDRRDRSRVS